MKSFLDTNTHIKNMIMSIVQNTILELWKIQDVLQLMMLMFLKEE